MFYLYLIDRILYEFRPKYHSLYYFILFIFAFSAHSSTLHIFYLLLSPCPFINSTSNYSCPLYSLIHQHYIYSFHFSFTSHSSFLHVFFLPLLFTRSFFNPTAMSSFFSISLLIRYPYTYLFFSAFSTHLSTLHLTVLLLFPR